MLLTNNEFDDSGTDPWDAPYWEFQDALNRGAPGAGEPLRFPDLEPGLGLPPMRPRLHVLCALYAHSRQLDQRLSVLDSLEELTLQVAQTLAVELLEKGWRPATKAAA
jgi:hypothetical protein